MPCPRISRHRPRSPACPESAIGRPGDMERLAEEAINSFRTELEQWQAAGNKGPMPPANFLAISGGGENGAYGAGLLCGWTEAGTRPEFKLVTGISTGALTAPFAFLGPAYDQQLKDVYTTITAKDVLEERGIFAAIWNDAMADNAPLQNLVAKYVDADLLAAIAAEHRKGRNLLVGTTNLDARRGVVWDIGKIAEYGTPEALELVRKILIASAAIPGAFPPMMFDVEANGTKYQEMHVDGGANCPAFRLSGPATRRRDFRSGRRRTGTAHVHHPQRTPRSRLGGYGAPDLDHRRAGGVVPDPESGQRRSLSHLCRRPAGQGGFQSGLHTRDLRCAAARAVRSALHAGAVQSRL